MVQLRLARVIQLYLPEFKIYFELDLLILETLPKLSATPISYYFQVLTQVNQLKQTKIKPFVSSDFHYFALLHALEPLHCGFRQGKARHIYLYSTFHTRGNSMCFTQKKNEKENE